MDKRQTDGQKTDRQMDKRQTDGQKTDRQLDKRQTDRWTDRQMDKRQPNRQTDRQTDIITRQPSGVSTLEFLYIYSPIKQPYLVMIYTYPFIRGV